MSDQVASETNSLAEAAKALIAPSQQGNTGAQVDAAQQQAANEQKPAGNALDEILKGTEDEKIAGKPLHEHPRFQELVQQKNEFKQAAESYKAAMAEMEQEVKTREQLNSTFLELYTQYENPQEVLRLDAQLADVMQKLNDAGDPTVKAALARIESFIRGEKPVVPQTRPQSQKPSAAEEKLNQLLTQQWHSAADSLVNSSKIRPELRTLLKEGALSLIDTKGDVNQETLLKAFRDFISRNGWDQQFLTGSTAKNVPPTAKGGAVTASPNTASGPTSPKNPEDITDPNDLRRLLQERFRQLAES